MSFRPFHVVKCSQSGDATIGCYHTTQELAGSEGRNTFDVFNNETWTVEVYSDLRCVSCCSYNSEKTALHDFDRLVDRLHARENGLTPDASNDPAW